MALFWRSKEERGALVPQSAPNFLEALGLKIFGAAGDISVSMDEALGVPAVWAAVNFIPGTIAGLPLHVYDKDSQGNKKKVKASKLNPFVAMLHDAVNEGTSSFQWRFNTMQAVLTEGRAVAYIERDDRGQPTNLWPLPGVSVAMLSNGRKRYTHRAGGKETVYDQSDVLDFTFMLYGDLVSHRSPLRQCATAIGKAVHANSFGAKLFKNGGLPAHALIGPFGSGAASSRAAEDITRATQEAAQKGGTVLAIPVGHDLKPLGTDADKMQLVEAQRFAVEEIARIYSLPPTFLQDLSRATFSNSEQQDLHLVKHTIKRWVEQIEQEMNLKFFGRESSRFVEFNLDGLLRGDYKTRMDGNAQAIQSGQLTPNEARAADNREPLDGGDVLFIQGATVPLAGQQAIGADNAAT